MAGQPATLVPEILVTEEEFDDRFSVRAPRGNSWSDLSRGDLMTFVMEAVTTALIDNVATAVALHAGAVSRCGKVILIVGSTGTGKTSLVAWLTDHGFSYISDE